MCSSLLFYRSKDFRSGAQNSGERNSKEKILLYYRKFLNRCAKATPKSADATVQYTSNMHSQSSVNQIKILLTAHSGLGLSKHDLILEQSTQSPKHTVTVLAGQYQFWPAIISFGRFSVLAVTFLSSYFCR